MAAALVGCEAPDEPPASLVAEASDDDSAVVSLLGDTLEFPEFDDETMARLRSDALEAAANLEADPSAENFVWLGRRLAYLWRYERAIAVYTNGLSGFPDNAELYRHRGHRYVTMRRFSRAIADLRNAATLVEGTADVVERDGIPNEANLPRTTLQFNVHYHLGLAYYLVGDFERASGSFRDALDLARNDDARVAATDWLYMSLRRNQRHNQAASLLDTISPDMDILENDSYHRRLLMYKGMLPADSLLRPDTTDALAVATQGYGVANWHLYNGRPDAADSLFRLIVDGDYWPAFGHIAAEAELARNASR